MRKIPEGTKISCRACGVLCYELITDVTGDDVIREADLKRLHEKLPELGNSAPGSLFPKCPDCGGRIF